MKSRYYRFHVQKFCTWIYAFALMSAIMACSKEKLIVNSFPVEKELQGKRVDALDTIYTSFSVYWNNGKLFLSTKGDYHLAIYDEVENRITKTLHNGKGHNEWIAPLITTQQISIEGSLYNCVLERANSILYGVNLDDSCSQKICVQDFTRMNIPGIRNVFLLSDSTYWGIKNDDICDIFKYDIESKKLTEEKVDIDHSLFNPNSQNLSQNMATFCPQSGKIAIAYYTFPYLLIIEEGQSSALVQIQIGESPVVYNKDNAFDPHFYILDICSTDKYIYILYDTPSIKGKTAILVFDWQGTPIAKYQTERMTAFTVDEINSRFFALNEDESNGVCSVYYF